MSVMDALLQPRMLVARQTAALGTRWEFEHSYTLSAERSRMLELHP